MKIKKEEYNYIFYYKDKEGIIHNCYFYSNKDLNDSKNYNEKVKELNKKFNCEGNIRNNKETSFNEMIGIFNGGGLR